MRLEKHSVVDVSNTSDLHPKEIIQANI